MTAEQYDNRKYSGLPQVTPVNFSGTSVLLTETDHKPDVSGIVEDWVPEADLWNDMKDAPSHKFERAMKTVMARFEASVAPEPEEE